MLWRTFATCNQAALEKKRSRSATVNNLPAQTRSGLSSDRLAERKNAEKLSW
jgi:hypothetical protein